MTIATPKFVDQIARLQHTAGVKVLHHDSRSVPQPMTAEALAVSGTAAPARSRGGSSSAPGRGGGYSKSYGGARSGGYRGQGSSSRSGAGAKPTWKRSPSR